LCVTMAIVRIGTDTSVIRLAVVEGTATLGRDGARPCDARLSRDRPQSTTSRAARGAAGGARADYHGADVSTTEGANREVDRMAKATGAANARVVVITGVT